MTAHRALAASTTTAAEATDQALAWTIFWREQGPRSRCLDGASPDVHRMLSDHWASFAARLQPAARVLDLGCGSGVVARTLASARRDLRVVGVDAAQIPSMRHPMFRILSGTPIESLPFRDGTSDAAVSQFGFEYSDTREAARELARVLAPGARFSFVVHHSESAIVRGSGVRNRALRALIDPSVKALLLSGDAAALGLCLQSLEARYPDDAAIRLAARGLLSAIGRTSAERLRFWEAVVDAVEPERILADALEASCVAPDKLREWLQPLNARFDVRRPCVLWRWGAPLAWKIEGERAV